jgi:predicted DNA-binding transcriptional regulator YafY
MRNNKNAPVRYNILNSCFRNTGRLYTKDDLLKIVNERLREKGINADGIKMRQLEFDISEMIKMYEIEFDDVKVDRKKAFRYVDTNFSIDKKPLSDNEMLELKNTVEFLNRVGGLPNSSWVNELSVRLETEMIIDNNNQQFIDFEKNIFLKGYETFYNKFFQFIINERVIKLTYSKYATSNSEVLQKVHIFHPQYLKQYNNRWFVFGWNDTHSAISNFPLDRIIKIEETEGDYKKSDIDWVDYFDDIVGVSMPNKDEKPQKIILEIDKTLYPYIESKPLHSSQTKIKDNSTEITTCISLNLIINYEFESLLLSHGSRIKIIEPKELVGNIKRKLQESLANY